MRKLFSIFLLALGYFSASAQTSASGYIEKYKEAAILQMNMYGIPASIVLGIAMHESANGNSRIAKLLNNHFGMKGRNLKPEVKSAYKSYESVESCYGDFIGMMKNRKQFSSLFTRFSDNDYKAWALAIQRAGYAASKTWARQVMDIIQKNRLYEFDNQPDSAVSLAVTDNALTQPAPVNESVLNRLIYKVRTGDTLNKIAARFRTSVRSIVQLNGLRSIILQSGQTAQYPGPLMKFRLILFIFSAALLASCGTRKAAVRKPVQQPPKVISENTLVKKFTADEYINRFKTIAVSEMNLYGIPASITLSQGLLESGNGNGSLAREANNHFGIKCNTDWKGRTILKDDDQKDDCFRVYNTPEESFRDHSEFLKRKRYAFLFELDKNDYKGWASGLKQAGYATNPRYPELLITIIERYGLDKYDRRETEAEKTKREDKVLTEIVDNIPEDKKIEIAKPPVAMRIYEVKAGDTLYSVSKRFGITVEDLKLLNSLQGGDLKTGQLLLVSK